MHRLITHRKSDTHKAEDYGFCSIDSIILLSFHFLYLYDPKLCNDFITSTAQNKR